MRLVFRGLTGLCAAAVFAMAAHGAAAAQSRSQDEQDIRALQIRLAASVSARDLDAIMTNYVPGDELFVFDSDLPRQHTGWASFKQDWGKLVNAAKTIQYDVEDLGVTVEGNAAFSHHLAHIVWTKKTDGSRSEQLLSISDAYRRIGGKWLIVMEHFSVPVVDGKAVYVARP